MTSLENLTGLAAGAHSALLASEVLDAHRAIVVCEYLDAADERSEDFVAALYNSAVDALVSFFQSAHEAEHHLVTTCSAAARTVLRLLTQAKEVQEQGSQPRIPMVA